MTTTWAETTAWSETTVPGRRRQDDDLPSTLERSGKRARDTWSAAHAAAVEQYGGGQRAHRTAWAALKHTYEKVGDHWEPKEGGRRGPSDRQAAEGGADTDLGTAGGVDTVATKEHLHRIATRLDVTGRSRMTKAGLVEAIQAADDRETARSRQREQGFVTGREDTPVTPDVREPPGVVG